MRPHWRRLLGPGLLTAIMLAVLIGLGTWQVYRLQWKEGLLAQIAAAEEGAPKPLGAAPAPFEKLAVTGRFRYDLAAWYGDDVRLLRTGPQMGFFQIVPLERPGGPPILVDRGWVPDRRDARIDKPGGTVSVEGYAMPPQGGSWFSPAGDPASRHFYVLDAAAIGQALHLPAVAPYILVALGPEQEGLYPAPASHLPRPPNNHLSYAITWYGLALALAVIFITWARRALRS